MMNESQNNEQLDDDILECKADILRAKDVVPPFRKEKPPESKPQEQKHPADAIEEPNSADVENSGEPPKTQPQHKHIPKFDLSEKIMVEHRKASSQKRKKPGREPKSEKPKPQVRGYAVRQPEPVSRGQGQIIADIVARDIRKLCRSGNV